MINNVAPRHIVIYHILLEPLLALERQVVVALIFKGEVVEAYWPTGVTVKHCHDGVFPLIGLLTEDLTSSLDFLQFGIVSLPLIPRILILIGVAID